MTADNTKIFRIVIDYKAAEKNLQAINNGLKDVNESSKALVKSQRELKKQYDDGEISKRKYNSQDKKNAAAMAELRSQQVALSAEKKTALKIAQLLAVAEKAESGSITALEAQLKALRLQYKGLSQDKRNDANVGGKLLKQIDETSAKVKELNQTIAAPRKKGWLEWGVVLGNIYTQAINGVKQLISKGAEWVKQGIEMAAKAEGITTAFNKLDSPNLLDNLRQATKGTVNDLLLMQSAVKAENFGIPLNKLGSLLKFAQQRAQETGESVDYLTSSIINGIGRKSPLILDNLGISAARLSEEVKKTGDFTAAASKIIEEELTKQGDLALTSADKAQQASVKWENAQLKVGEKLTWVKNLWSEISGKIADGISDIVGESKTASEAFDDQMKKVVDLERNVVPLVARYEELKSKSKLTSEEQVELNKILNSISSSVPGVVTEFDKYGNILTINTGKVYAYLEAEKARLQWVHRDAIKETTDAMEKIQKKQARLQAEYNAGGTYRGAAFFPYSKEKKAELDKQIKELGVAYAGAEAELKRIDGTTFDEQKEQHKKYTDEQDKFNEMNKSQLMAWIKDTKNANSEYLELANQIYTQKFGAEGGTGGSNIQKQGDDRIKIIADSNKKILEQQNQLTNAEIALMKDGVAKKLAQQDLNSKKEIEKAENDYKEQIRKINEIQKKYTAGSSEYAEFEKQKSELTSNYEKLATQSVEVEAKKRHDILVTYSKSEIENYRNTLTDKDKIREADIALEEKRLQDEFDREAERVDQVVKLQFDTAKKINDANRNYKTERDYIDATIKNEGERRNAILRSEIEIRRAKMQTYKAELESLRASGRANSERYQEILKELGEIQAQLINIGEGKNADGSGGQSMLARILGLPKTPEEWDAAWEQTKQILRDGAFNIASDISNLIADSEKTAIDQRLKSELKHINDVYNANKTALDKRHNSGLISEKKYNQELEKLEKDKQAQEDAANRKAFEEKKRADIKYAIMNTALSIGNAMATVKPFLPAGLAAAGIAAIKGGLEVATIKNQKYAKGGVMPLSSGDGYSMGVVQGPSHANGGVRIYAEGNPNPIGEVEGNEVVAIVNKRSSKVLRGLSTINQLGGGHKFADGGIMYGANRWSTPSPAPLPNSNSWVSDITSGYRSEADSLRELVVATNKRIDRIQVVVTESAISESQSAVKAIVEQAGF